MEWFDKIIEQGKKKAEASNDAFIKGAGISALGLLEKHKEDVLALGKDYLTSLVSNIAAGNTDEAKKLYIEKIATPDELILGVEKSADIITDADTKFREASRRIDSILKSITGTTARYLLPLII